MGWAMSVAGLSEMKPSDFKKRKNDLMELIFLEMDLGVYWSSRSEVLKDSINCAVILHGSAISCLEAKLTNWSMSLP